MLLLPCGAYKGSALVFVIIHYLDYSRALILLANFNAHLLLGLSLPFSAIPPSAAGVVPRLRESTWTTRMLDSFLSVISTVTYALRIGLYPLPKYRKCLKIGSCGVGIGPHCVATLYQGELQ